MRKEEEAKPFQVRLTEEEKRLFEKAAELEGFHGIGTWMRSKLIAIAKRVLKKGGE